MLRYAQAIPDIIYKSFSWVFSIFFANVLPSPTEKFWNSANILRKKNMILTTDERETKKALFWANIFPFQILETFWNLGIHFSINLKKTYFWEIINTFKVILILIVKMLVNPRMCFYFFWNYMKMLYDKDIQFYVH